jgi:hypothetical protein
MPESRYCNLPRRATSTSFGASRGNGRGKGNQYGANAKVFQQRMKALAERAAQAKRWERLLSDANKDDDLFLKAFDRLADRAYGRPATAVDVTSDGEKVQSLLVLPPES